MEVRAENTLLEERILDIVREEKGYSEQDDVEEEDEEIEEAVKAEGYAMQSRSMKVEPKQSNSHSKKAEPEPTIQDIEVEEVDDDVSILQVAEEQKPQS